MREDLRMIGTNPARVPPPGLLSVHVGLFGEHGGAVRGNVPGRGVRRCGPARRRGRYRPGRAPPAAAASVQ